MWNPFRKKPQAAATPAIDAEHLQLRRAIERCDALKPAYDTGQLTLRDLIATLERNNFSDAVIRKAVAESLGEEISKDVR